jgi:hypothetical protein
MKSVVSKLAFRMAGNFVLIDLKLKNTVFLRKNIVFEGYILPRYCLHRIPRHPLNLEYNDHFVDFDDIVHFGGI